MFSSFNIVMFCCCSCRQDLCTHVKEEVGIWLHLIRKGVHGLQKQKNCGVFQFIHFLACFHVEKSMLTIKTSRAKLASMCGDSIKSTDGLRFTNLQQTESKTCVTTSKNSPQCKIDSEDQDGSLCVGTKPKG